MANKFIKGLTELTSVLGADHLVFQPDSASQIGNRITVSNFLSSIDHISKIGTPVNNQLSVWTGDGTLEGEPNLTYDGTYLRVGLSAGEHSRIGDHSITLFGEDNVIGVNSLLYSNTASNSMSGQIQRFGGSIGSPAAVPTDCEIRNEIYKANDGSSTITAGKWLFKVDGVVAANDFDTKYEWYLKEGAGANALMVTLGVDGFEYAADHSTDQAANDRWIPDKAYVDNAAGGGGDVVKVGTPVDNQIGVWTGDGTIEGTSGLTYDGTSLDITGAIDVAEISNTSGILKIQPDVQGNVELFGDTDVAPGALSKEFRLHRRSAAHDTYFRIFIDGTQSTNFKSTAGSLAFEPVNGNVLFAANSNSNFQFGSTSRIWNGNFDFYGYITAASTGRYARFKVDDATDQFVLSRQSTDILGFKVNMPLEVEEDIITSGHLNLQAGSELILRSQDGIIRFRADWATMMGFKGDSSLTQTVWFVKATFGNQICLSGETSLHDDFDHPSQTNPTLFIHSVTRPTTDSTQWISLAHDQTDGILNVGKGVLKINVPLDVVGDITLSGTVDGIDIATDVAANTSKATNATHTGDVTGSEALTIAVDAVDLAMLSATGTPSSSTYLRGDNTWSTVSGSGDVSKVGTPVDNQIGVWTGDGTIEGTSGLTYDGTSLAITGAVDVAEIANSGGNLKLNADAEGDVEFFGDTDVANNEDGKALYIRRKAAEGDDYIQIFYNQYKEGQIIASNALFIKSGSSMFLTNLAGTFNFGYAPNGDATVFKVSTSGKNFEFKQYGYITAATGEKYISWKVDDATDKFILDREDSNILGFKVNMPLEVADEITALELNINQTDDNYHFKIHGFDDQALSRFEIKVASNGIPFINAFGSDGSTPKKVFFATGINVGSNVVFAFGGSVEYSIIHVSADDSLRFKADNGARDVLVIDTNDNIEIFGAFTQNELSADPSDPAEGSFVTWMSDGTGSGDDGDIVQKITSASSTETRIYNQGLATSDSPTFAGLDVQGNITLTGTVDGIDIATDVTANTSKVSNLPASDLSDYADMTAMIAGQSNQTIGNLYYTTDTDGYWVLIVKTASSSDYRGGGVIEENIQFFLSDFVTDISTGTKDGYWLAPWDCTVQSAIGGLLETAPTGSSAIFDINKNGTTMMTTDKVEIEAGSNTSIGATTQPAFTTTAISKGDIITCDIDQVGSSTPGKVAVVNLTVTRE